MLILALRLESDPGGMSSPGKGGRVPSETLDPNPESQTRNLVRQVRWVIREGLMSFDLNPDPKPINALTRNQNDEPYARWGG